MKKIKLVNQNWNHTKYTANIIKAAEEKTKDKEFSEKEVLQTLESEKDCYNKYQFCLIYSRCPGMKFLILWKLLPYNMFSNSI